MRFFFDNCLSHKLPRALRELDDEGHTIVHLSEKFSRDAKDLEWLPKLKEEGDWIIISVDLFNKTAEEHMAMRNSAAAVFIFAEGHGELPRWEMFKRVVSWWPRIVDQAKLANRNACFKIPMTSTKFKPY